MAKEVKRLSLRRYLSYWLGVIVGYGFPLVYFMVQAGVMRQANKIVMPTLIAGIFLVIRLSRDVPEWTRTWQPSMKKGLVLALPKIVIFIILISLGLALKWLVEKQIEASFFTYFETVFVIFGGQAVGAIIDAYHLKYKQLSLIKSGYVMGVVNR